MMQRNGFLGAVMLPGLIAGALLTGASGCASRKSFVSPSSQPTAATQPATRPAGIALLSLDEIQPVPTLAQPRKIDPDKKPPIEAIELFARARGAMHDRQRFTAIGMLSNAAKLDPDSFAIQFALGEAYQGQAAWQQQSIAAFSVAAEINPDSLETHVRIGRQLLAKGDVAEAIWQFRMARLTTEFAKDEEQAAITNFFLARALQQKGYGHAALAQYQELLERIENARFELRRSPELSYYIGRPELLLVQIGELHLKNGDYSAARTALTEAAAKMADNLDVQALLARSLLLMNQVDDAKKLAGDLVVRNRASVASLNLLRDIYKQAGQESQAVDDLSVLVEKNPQDRTLLHALANMLKSQNRPIEARDLLARSLHKDADFATLRRLTDLDLEAHDTKAAATALIEACAQRPDLHEQTAPIWFELIRNSTKNRLKISTLQNLKLAPETDAARLTWIAEVAEDHHRDLLAKTSLEQAVKSPRPYPPAYRMLVKRIWSDESHNDDEKMKLSEALWTKCPDPIISAEIRGRALMNNKQAAQAIAALKESIQLGNKSPNVQLALAAAIGRNGDRVEFEQMLWKLVENHPTFSEAYQFMFGYYLGQRAGDQAIKVIRTWTSHDPDNLQARLNESLLALELGRGDLAEQQMLKLFEAHPDDAELISLMIRFYNGQGRLNDITARLEDERAKHPTNVTVAEFLANIYREERRIPEATRVLDATREAIKNDADLLYGFSNNYYLVDQKETVEQVLQQVLDLEPRHASACNDLGYVWADRGENLSRAEDLIRIAVEGEPENESFIDSLGWVLYKRGKFAEAEVYLRKAVDDALFPDPVVLDHLGDTLMRENRKELAIDVWNRAQERISKLPEREVERRRDVKELIPVLKRKLEQAGAGGTISVASTAEEEAAKKHN